MVSNYCFRVPILPGGIEQMRIWNEQNIINSENMMKFLGRQQQEYHVRRYGFNIYHKEILQLAVMRLMTLNNHSKY
jgi:hypothetical protein